MKYSLKHTLIGSTIILSSGFGVAGFAGVAGAQEVEEFIVTGSRIARKDLIATSPLTTITARDIDITGFNQAADLLNELPQACVPEFTDTNTNRDSLGVGLSTIDLRNLGA